MWTVCVCPLIDHEDDFEPNKTLGGTCPFFKTAISVPKAQVKEIGMFALWKYVKFMDSLFCENVSNSWIHCSVKMCQIHGFIVLWKYVKFMDSSDTPAFTGFILIWPLSSFLHAFGPKILIDISSLMPDPHCADEILYFVFALIHALVWYWGSYS